MPFALATPRKSPPAKAGLLNLLKQTPWALGDQMLISATNFITIILLARDFSQAALGSFTLVYSALLFVNSVQSGLITQPHNILGVTRRGKDYLRYTSSTAISQLLLAGFAAILAAAGWVIAHQVDSTVAPLLLALVPAILAWQLQEFIRRVLYTEGRLAAAFANDLISYGGQAALIAGIWWRSSLNGPLALYVLAATSALGALLGFWQIRGSLIREFDRAVVQENWHFGKWVAGGEIVGHWLSAQLLVYLAAALLGAAAVGVLRAVHTLFGPSRVLADVFCTILPIRFARTWAERGNKALDLQLKLAYLAAIPLLGGYCLLVAIFAKPLLSLFYRDRYIHSATVLALYAAATFISYLTMIVAAALRSKRRTRRVFTSQLYASLITLPIGWLLIEIWTVNGAVFGMIATYLVMSWLLWRAYQHGQKAEPVEAAEGTAHANVLRVLQQLTGDAHGARHAIEKLGEGHQATTFAVRSRNGRPVWQSHGDVVVKMYKANGNPPLELVHHEFESLCRLNARLTGGIIDGWMVHSPEPLGRSDRPLAVVMTEAKGVALSQHLRSDRTLPAELRDSIARAVVGALERYWAGEPRIYGDACFSNILCNVAERTISFIDPNVPEPAYLCEEVSRDWYPASRDLAYLLFDVAASVKAFIAHPYARRNHMELAEAILRTFVEKIGCQAQKHRLLDEIHACTRVHLKRIQVSGSPAGCCRLLIRRIAARKIDAILSRLRNALPSR